MNAEHFWQTIDRTVGFEAGVGSPENMLKHLAAVAGRYGLTVWQWFPGPVGVHAQGSYHYKRWPDGVGRAFDAKGPRLRMWAYAWHLRLYYRKHLTEGIHNAGLPGRNLSVKYGQNVPASYWDSTTWQGHTTHVHVAI